MTGLEAVSAVGPAPTDLLVTRLGLAHASPAQTPPPVQASSVGFADMLADGMRNVDAKVTNANELVRQFTLDDSVPLHQVTFALEEARMSVEMAMQIRGRLVESYREMMNMQL